MEPELKPDEEQDPEVSAQDEIRRGMRMRAVGVAKPDRPDPEASSFRQRRMQPSAKTWDPATSAAAAASRASSPPTPVTPPPPPGEAAVGAQGADAEPVDRESKARELIADPDAWNAHRRKVRKSAARTMDRPRKQKQAAANFSGEGKETKSGPIEKTYREEMAAKFPDERIASWKGKGYGVKMRSIACNIVDACDGDQEFAKTCVRYVVRKWDDINKRYLKGTGTFPDLTFLQGFFSKLHIEAQRWRAFADVEKEWNDWMAKHPSAFKAPSELQKRYDAAKAIFESGSKG